MKRYIRASDTINNSVFNMKTTEMPYFDQFLYLDALVEEDYDGQTVGDILHEYDNTTGHIEYMTYDEYVDTYCNYRHIPVADIRYQTEELSESKVDNYTKLMKSGIKFPLPVLELHGRGSQEGLRRLYSASLVFGEDCKFPVLVTRAVDSSKPTHTRLYWCKGRT